MTSWHRKANKQHKELRTVKYRQRVVPVEKQEILEKAAEEEARREIEEAENELNTRRTEGKT